MKLFYEESHAIVKFVRLRQDVVWTRREGRLLGNQRLVGKQRYQPAQRCSQFRIPI